MKAPRDNRSFEYDTLSDQYARFLLEEFCRRWRRPQAAPRRRRARGRRREQRRIAAFTVAWERPNEFSKVLSWIGSFTNIPPGKTLRDGGHNYAAMS